MSKHLVEAASSDSDDLSDLEGFDDEVTETDFFPLFRRFFLKISPFQTLDSVSVGSLTMMLPQSTVISSPTVGTAGEVGLSCEASAVEGTTTQRLLSLAQEDKEIAQQLPEWLQQKFQQVKIAADKERTGC